MDESIIIVEAEVEERDKVEVDGDVNEVAAEGMDEGEELDKNNLEMPQCQPPPSPSVC